MKHWTRKYINKSFTFTLFILLISQLCVSSAIAAPLVDGQSISISESVGGTEAEYHIDVSSGATSLQLDMSGGTGDADMYVRFGEMPTTSTYDCRPWKNGNEETCQVDNPSEGRWYVMIRAYNPYSGVTLSAASDGGATSSGAPTAISPSGTITTNHPTFTWTAVSGSNQYAVYAKDATGELKVWNVVGANHAGCESGTGTCSYTHSTAEFSEGSGGFWKVMTTDDGYGPESNTLNFTVNTQQTSENELSPDGQSITIAQSTESAQDHFFVDVVSGASSLLVQISEGTGDADLHVRFGEKPTLSSYDCRPWENGNEEACQFDNPQEGRWYVMIAAYNAYSEVNLSATVETEDSSCDMSIDSDGDRLPDCYETNTGHFVSIMDTGTDPNNVDTDGDAIPDGDEVLGTLDGLDLPGMGVSPVHKDLLVEYDWFEDSRDCGFHSHRPTEEIVNLVSDGYGNAPADIINNPDGEPGINVIHDYGQGGLFTGGNFIEDDDGIIDDILDHNNQQSNTYFENLKNENFDNNRRGYFHRILLGHHFKVEGVTKGYSGIGELPGDDTIVTTACVLINNTFHPEATGVEIVANTIMHELGHNLELKHGGNEGLNYKPNYNSVMNYRFQFPGVDADSSCDAQPDGILSYSRGDRLTLDEENLDETKGVCGDIAIDFNGSGEIDFDFLVPAEINIKDYVRDSFIEWNNNGNNAPNVLHDHNDWAHLNFSAMVASGVEGNTAITTWEMCQEIPGSH